MRIRTYSERPWRDSSTDFVAYARGSISVRWRFLGPSVFIALGVSGDTCHQPENVHA